MSDRQVRIDIDIEPPQEVKDFITENEEKVATEIETRAKATAEFIDKTGLLRRKIKKKKSRYDEGGFIVRAVAPHAHLVEFGHAMVDWKTMKVVGQVKPHPFLRQAKEEVITTAKQLFGIK